MKAIETKYKGYRFRSRLEARWAVFFDALDLRWEYEKEGYDINGIRYLPDFYINDKGGGYFIEIKGKSPTEEEIDKCRALSILEPTFLFIGQIEPPQIRSSLEGSWAMSFPKIKHVGKDMKMLSKMLEEGVLKWHCGNLTSVDWRPYCWHERLAADKRRDVGTFLLWPYPANDFKGLNPATGEIIVVNPLKVGTKAINSERLLNAYDAARSARFEFGEKGN